MFVNIKEYMRYNFISAEREINYIFILCIILYIVCNIINIAWYTFMWTLIHIFLSEIVWCYTLLNSMRHIFISDTSLLSQVFNHALHIYITMTIDYIYIVAISFRAPSLQLVVYIDNTTAISNDRSPRTWVHSYGSTTRGYIMVQNIMTMRRCDAGVGSRVSGSLTRLW